MLSTFLFCYLWLLVCYTNLSCLSSDCSSFSLMRLRSYSIGSRSILMLTCPIAPDYIHRPRSASEFPGGQFYLIYFASLLWELVQKLRKVSGMLMLMG
ncbi:hypothetical protein BZA77DRAFT_110465 [Pyronema omphalodes]|nr:hypothetical protein BZA77DRAFT_110465 [Pyronema omphalodes]